MAVKPIHNDTSMGNKGYSGSEFPNVCCQNWIRCSLTPLPLLLNKVILFPKKEGPLMYLSNYMATCLWKQEPDAQQLSHFLQETLVTITKYVLLYIMLLLFSDSKSSAFPAYHITISQNQPPGFSSIP